MGIYYDSVMVTFFIFLGAVFASFFAATFYRLDNHIPVFSSDRSRCDYCNRELKWYENFPLLSYVALEAKTACCENPIPAKYAIYEFFGAAVGGVSFFTSSPIANAILLFLSVLVVLLDYESLSIYRFLLIGTIVAASARYLVIGGSVKALFLMVSVSTIFNIFFYYLNHKRGFGDVLFGLAASIVAGSNLSFSVQPVSSAVSKLFVLYALGALASIAIEVFVRRSKLSKGAKLAATPIYLVIILGFLL